MNSLLPRLIRSALVAGSALMLLSCATPPPDASAVLARSSQAMGTGQLNTLRYIGEGTGYTFGQAYKAGGAWPKITLHSVTRSIDYGTATMRDEVVLSRAEPLGGGGYPLTGQQRNDQFVSGEIAWNQVGTTATPGAALRHRPHAPALDHAARRDQGGDARRRPGDRRRRRREPRSRSTGPAASPPPPTSPSTAWCGGSNRPSPTRCSATRRWSRPTTTTARSAASSSRCGCGRRSAAIRCSTSPSRRCRSTRRWRCRVPEAARNVAERVTSEKVADGVWFVTGGSHNSVLIELRDRLILVEAPLNDARTQAVIEHVKGLVPGKPIRFVVNSHQHFDHAGGLRAAVAEGADHRHPGRQRALLRARLRPGEPDPPRRHGPRRPAADLPGRAQQARDRRRDPAGRGAPHRRRPAQRQLPHGLPAAGKAADRGRRLHPGSRRTRRRRRWPMRTTSIWSTTSSGSSSASSGSCRCTAGWCRSRSSTRRRSAPAPR